MFFFIFTIILFISIENLMRNFNIFYIYNLLVYFYYTAKFVDEFAKTSELCVS